MFISLNLLNLTHSSLHKTSRTPEINLSVYADDSAGTFNTQPFHTSLYNTRGRLLLCVLQIYLLHLMHVDCVFLSNLGPHTLQRFILLLFLLWYFSLSHSRFSAIQKTKALHAEMSNMSKKYITGGQRSVLHFAAVGSHKFVHVVHTSFCGVTVQDDLWFSMLLPTDSPIPVQCSFLLFFGT